MSAYKRRYTVTIQTHEIKQCKACQTREKYWNGDNPVCSFRNGSFNAEGWMCATSNAIRDICLKEGDARIQHHRTVGQHYATISTLDFDVLTEEYVDGYSIAQPVCLWVGWYKDRGTTEGMWLMFENTPPRAPTADECVKIIEHYSAVV